MDILESFIKKDNRFSFNKLVGDFSAKQFYEMREFILIKISDHEDKFDEYFEEDCVGLSQFDYFKFTFDFFYKKLGNVPKILAINDPNSLILMENKGHIRMKEHLNEINFDKKYIYQTIDWLIKLQNLSIEDENIINKHHYGMQSMEKEIKLFIDWYLKYLNQNDLKIFASEIHNLFKLIIDSKQTINHRDFQPRNILIQENNIYVIDTQDACIGPYICDISTLLFNTCKLFDDDDRTDFVNYYFKNQTFEENYSKFFQKFLIYAFIRTLKSIGSHSRYLIRDNNYASLEIIQKNKLMLDDLKSKLNLPIMYNILDKNKLIPVILAAGKGTRMNSFLPKTLCEINGKPMLYYILDTVVKLNPHKIIIIVGHKKEVVIEKILKYPYKNIEIIEQKELLGTGQALMEASSDLKNFPGQLLILFGDKPLITLNTLEKLVSNFYENNFDASLLSYLGETSFKKNGRIIKENNKIVEVHEDENLDFISNEFVGGVQLYNSIKLFENLHLINNNNAKKEYYLADVIKIMTKKNLKIGSMRTNNLNELLNVNTSSDLETARLYLNSI